MDKSRKFGALLLTLVFLLTYTSGVNAQLVEKEGMYLGEQRLFYAGVVAGANFAQIDGDNFAGYYKAGLNVGGIGYVHLKDHFALSWEILYSQKGAKSNISRLSIHDTAILLKDYRVQLNYAEIPVMLNYFDKRKSHAGIGLAYNRLVGSSEVIDTDPPNTIDLNSKYPYKKNGLDFLAGAQLHLWKGLFFNVRFQYSIIPLRSESPAEYVRTQKQHNNMWVVRLMYLFM